MKTTPLAEVKQGLQNLEAPALRELCLRLAKYRNENKELFGYLLFEADDEQNFIREIKEEMEVQFNELTPRNVYYTKKTLRKILRFTNRQIKFSELKSTELELRLFFCQKMKVHRIPMAAGTVLYNLYQQQLSKLMSALSTLPEDLRLDYQQELSELS